MIVPRPFRAGRRAPSDGTALLLFLLACGLAAGRTGPSGQPGAASPRSAAPGSDVPALLRAIRGEVVTMERYPGEDFARGEFFLGEGDDDTNKTHAVGILVKDEEAGGGSRMTVVVSRLEPGRGEPRVKYARDPKTIVCAFAAGADGVALVRSDYATAELEKLLPAVLKAVLDKKALLKKPPF